MSRHEMKVLLWTLVGFLLFRSSFYEPFRIPSGSMMPTLLIGDFIIVNKMTYGFKIPFTDIGRFNPIYLGPSTNPERGDVIVFKYPGDISTNYIKRVIAIPGDTVEMKHKILYVNGQEVPRKLLGSKRFFSMLDQKFQGYNYKFFDNHFGDHHFVTQLDADNYFSLHMEKKTVPQGQFFVMGDNRDYSRDSRFWGFVPREYIKGKAVAIWLSLQLPTIDQEFKFRPGRIGLKIN